MDSYARWAREVRTYWRDCERPGDFIRLMRVRLSQSKIGKWVTPRPIVVDVDLKSLGRGIRLRSHTTDISVLSEIVLGNSIGQLPEAPAPQAVIDLGANIGLAYRWLRRRYPAAQFVCVEPDPGNLEVLRANVASADGVCSVVPACIGGSERKVRLAGGDGEWGYRMVDVAESDHGDTPVLTMERILEETGIERIDILKCDIEGAEGELFSDCSRWIGRVEAMVVECHLDVISTESLMETLADNRADFALTHVERNPHLGFEIATLQRRADFAAASS